MQILSIENRDIFFLTGKINASTALTVQYEIEHMLKLKNELTVNIESVKEIDVFGVKALKCIYLNAIKNNQKFYITGNGCKELLDDFRPNEVAQKN